MMLYRYFALACLTLAAVGGCGRGHDYGPTGTVEGRLTHQGNALSADTKVVFMHTQNGVAAFGATDAQGNFKISTVRGNQVPIGLYRVMIQPPESQLGGDAEPTAEQLIDDPDINRPKQTREEFDFKYRQLSTSGLEFDVQEGPNEFQIELQ
jgi:hypothetical protein